MLQLYELFLDSILNCHYGFRSAELQLIHTIHDFACYLNSKVQTDVYIRLL